MLTSWISIKRWNNFPRIEDISHLDNVGFILHVAMFLAHLEEKNGNKVDKEFLIKKIIFSSIKILVISDINSGTRTYIEKVNKDIFSKLEQKVYDFILSLEAPAFLVEDMKKTITDRSKTLELSIISAARRYTSYRECLINRKVYEEMYEVPYKEIMASLEIKRQELKSLDTLLKNANYEKYLLNIRKLSHSYRWSKQKRIFPITVMAHLVLTTFLSYIIGMLENDKWWNFDIFEVLMIWLYHDIAESITWDIITPTKKAVSGFEEVLNDVEQNMLEDSLFCYIWKEYRNEIKKYITSPWTQLDWPLVKVADILSALFESKIEVNYGSTNFVEIYKNLKKKTDKLDYISLEYILKDVLKTFNKSSDDISL